MKVSRIKNSITFILLALFLTVKMAGLHVLSHSDDKEHIDCTICDNAIVHNLTPALTPDIQHFLTENIEIVIQKEIPKTYCFSVLFTIASNQLFSRPPPLI